MRKPYGFTLLEMAVVLAILCIIAGILFPAVSMARGRTQDRVCASNLSHVGKALLMYAQDNDGGIPHLTNDVYHNYSIEEGARPDHPRKPEKGGKIDHPDYLWETLGKYLNDREVLFCSGDPDAHQESLRWCIDHHSTSYLMQSFAPHFLRWTQDHLPLPLPDRASAADEAAAPKEADPSRLYFAADAELECPDYPMNADHRLSLISSHGGGYNYVAYDGSLHHILVSDLQGRWLHKKIVK